ncbi:unnamed protein product [Mycena citricolor]|uniref:Transglutaminase-like domain-containing protein n=1 Tax=Mycena citricolor TaxID=2018698 RepID=A0AAD2GX94_9AGAR|nr:unnamed protein product [Mycena citricolor]
MLLCSHYSRLHATILFFILESQSGVVCLKEQGCVIWIAILQLYFASSTMLRAPRRVPPPPPPAPLSNDSDENIDVKLSVRERIAHLQLDHVARPPVSLASKAPPRPPPRRNDSSLAQGLAPALPARRASDCDDAALNLARPPPPPVTKIAETPPPTHVPRRLPPRLATPPPEPEVDPTYQEEPLGDHDPDLEESASCIKCHDFSVIDEHAGQFPRHSVRSIPELAHALTEPWESETEKARAIFYWLHLNVIYDVQSFFSGCLPSQSPGDTLSTGLAVCDGFAGLFAELAAIAGLQVHKVTGHGKGYGYAAFPPGSPCPPEESNHAWNCALLDGEWRLLDPCWGAGALMGSEYSQRFAPVWFYSSASEFGRRHYPTDPSFQLLGEEDGGPVSWRDYILAPPGPVLFGSFDQLAFHAEHLQPSQAEIPSGHWCAFTLFKQCEHMSRDEADNYVYFIHGPDDRKTVLVPDAEGGWSASVYFPGGVTGDVQLNYVTSFDNRDAKGLSGRTFEKSLGRKAMAWSGLCKWTVV